MNYFLYHLFVNASYDYNFYKMFKKEPSSFLQVLKI